MKLSQAIALYIRRKQDAGMKFNASAHVLRSLLRHCGDVNLQGLTVQQVATFIAGTGVRPITWRNKRGTLQAFFDYWRVRNQLKSSPLPCSAPKITKQFVPYIYSRAELRSLVRAVSQFPQRSDCLMSAATFRTLLLFLYATGMRRGEALRLQLADIDMELGIATVRDTKFYKSRLVPVGTSLRKEIQQYLLQPGRKNQQYRPLFQTKSGNRIPARVVNRGFLRLRKIAGIKRHDDSSYQPRLHDLRHTFAVHRLTEWYRRNMDLQRLLPALSTYLGHVNLTATQRYLTMTPELLQLANHRFERYVYGGADEK